MKANLRILLIIAVVISAAFGVISCIGSEKEQTSGTQKCDFGIKDVYFNETNDPNYVLLTIQGIIGPNGFYKYIVHFPPQEGTVQGIGPIEVGRDEPCRDEKVCKPLNPCQEFITQDFIARSYPDNVPEFGKNYSAVIIFYLNDGSERKWEGKVGWKKIDNEQRLPIVRGYLTGSATISFEPFTPININANSGFYDGHAGGIQFWYLPVQQIVWGYRVYLDFEGISNDPRGESLIGNSWKQDPHYPSLFYRDFKAYYTQVGAKNTYFVQSNPQYVVLDELKAGKMVSL